MTKNNPGKYDCYQNAAPDEPMFVLLARDKHAPTLVWLWAVLRELENEDVEKVTEARNCVLAMLDWQVTHNRPAVGIAQSALAAVFELMRGCNLASELAGRPENKNKPTDIQQVRKFLCTTSTAYTPTPKIDPVKLKQELVDYYNSRDDVAFDAAISKLIDQAHPV